MATFPGARPTISARIRPRYPIRVVADAGLRADVHKGTLTIGLAYDDLTPDETPDEDVYVFAALNTVTGEYRLVSGVGGGGGVSDEDMEAILAAKAAAQAAAARAEAVADEVYNVLGGDAYEASSAADLVNAPTSATRAYVNTDVNPANIGLWTRPLGGSWTWQTADTLQTVEARVDELELVTGYRTTGPFVIVDGVGPASEVHYDSLTSKVISCFSNGVYWAATVDGVLAPMPSDDSITALAEQAIEDLVGLDGPFTLASNGMLLSYAQIDNATGRVIGGYSPQLGTVGVVDGALVSLGTGGGGGGGGGGLSTTYRAWTEDDTTRRALMSSASILYIVWIWGQSNANAQNDDTSDPLISTTPEYSGKALMPNVGPRIPVGAVNITSLVNLVENTPFTVRRETMTSALVNHFIKFAEDDGLALPQVCGFVSALNGTGIDEINAGSPTYENGKLALYQICEIARGSGYTPVVIGLHGVWGENWKAEPVEKVKAALRQFAQTWTADAMGITGQIEEPRVILSQISTAERQSNMELSGSTVAIGELHGYRNIRCAGPMYPFDISSDYLHLACRGQYHQGHMHARALYAEWAADGWNPVRIIPEKCRWRSSTVLDLECTVPGTSGTSGGLRELTGDAVTTPGWTDARSGLDFRTPDGTDLNGGVTLSFVERHSSLPKTIIRATFDSPVTTPVDVYAALRPNNYVAPDAARNGPVYGARSTIANTLGATAINGDVLNDWLCAARFQMPAPSSTDISPFTATTIKIGTGTKTATATAGAATLNKASGTITTEALTTAAGATYALVITNSTISASDIVTASVTFGTATEGLPQIAVVTPGSGALEIVVRNAHASQAFDGTLKIAFVAHEG